ncbi:MAG TPA: hypothetical protein DDW17_02375 [Deltaproteobacteria bacterium]|nr:hypothetical protein [Deltaproteobacteria bacterium]
MKYKKEFFWASIISIIFIVLVYLETQLPFFIKFLPVGENKLIIVMLNINLLLILLLLFLISRTLIKNYVEKKRGIWGAGLKTKLTFTLIFISIVPALTLFILATGFFNIGMEKWFSQKLEDTMEDALELSQFYYEDLFQRYEKMSQRLAHNIYKNKLLEKEKELNKYLQSSMNTYLLDCYALLDSSDTLITSGGNLGKSFDQKFLLKTKNILKEEPIRSIIPFKNGELILTGSKLYDESGNIQATLLTGDFIAVHGSEGIQEISSVIKEFREARPYKKLLKYSFLIPLFLVTILTVFFSIWVGIKMANEITIPIERVKEGATIIAKGKFDINLEDMGKDEIGTLVSAFNTMAKELKLTKDEIEERRRYMEVILDNVATGIISTDKRGKILLINKAALNIIGMERVSWRGAHLGEILGNDFKSIMKSFLREAKTTKNGSVTKEIKLNLKNDITYLRASMTILEDERGRVDGFIITFDDITHIVRAEKLATWQEVARKLTHEIKNPLTPIVLSAERLRRKVLSHAGSTDREVLDETTSVIIRSVDDIKGIVNELTKLTRISQEKTAEDINIIAEEAIGLYKNLYPNISFQMKKGNVPFFKMDRDGIKRVFINLITNAIKAINTMEGAISIITNYERGIKTLFIEVADTGKGIHREDREKIFDPYFTRDEEGMGLGLAIVHTIVLEHHGKIRVEDNKPRGIKFIIELPVIEG